MSRCPRSNQYAACSVLSYVLRTQLWFSCDLIRNALRLSQEKNKTVFENLKNAAMSSNNRPIIGILALEIANQLRVFGDKYTSYIAASYVKFLESAGARVVPIWISKERSYYENILKSINGVVFPGGATFFTTKNGFADAGKIIYDIAMDMNTKGQYFPLLGICLGYELLTYASANGKEHRQDCDSKDISAPLLFKDDFRDSKMFRNLPNDIEKILKTEAVTYNYHRYCITEQDMEDFDLKKDWKVLSVNKDVNGLEHVSIIEHRSHPFYGLQFHPERNAFEWSVEKSIEHSANAVAASNYFAKFFVDEGRKSLNKFRNSAEESKHLIYNFPITYTGEVHNSHWMQCYLFTDDSDYNKPN